MAVETRCTTPGAIYTTRIRNTRIEVEVEVPMVLGLNEDEAKHLEAVLHNAVEMALAPLFT